MAESDEVLEVRRRARRRLIGATALVMLLVIVPPWLMDLEPRPVTSTLTVEIPGKDQPKLDVPGAPATKDAKDAKDAKGSAPKAGKPAAEGTPAEIRGSVIDRWREEPAVSAKAEPTRPVTAPPVSSPPDAVKLPAVREPKAKSATDAQGGDKALAAAKLTQDDAQLAAAILKGETYFVPLGAFKSADNAKQIQQKVTGLGLRAYVEIVDVKGAEQSRVRAGPFVSRDTAEAARERLRGAGLEPGPVRTR